MSKRILYMSCHEILEYDEVKLFSELGYEVYSLGAYTQPGGDEHRKRPSLKLPYNPHFIELSLQYDRRRLHPEMLEGIDIVIVMHEPSFIGHHRGAHDWNESLDFGNWPLFREFIKKGGRVIWRSIGQSIPAVEHKLKPWVDEGLEVVRYSEKELTIQDNVGANATIHFYKDPAEFNGWSGHRKHAINFTQSLRQRGEFCGYKAIEKAMEGLPAKVYGPGNEDLGVLSGGLLSYDEQRLTMRDARAYLYHGTYPASYTLSFIEAMMTGIPMVCVGPGLGNGPMFPTQSTYEIPEIINQGVNGFYSDDIGELHGMLAELLNNDTLASKISKAGRARAIELFGKEKIAQQWREYLG